MPRGAAWVRGAALLVCAPVCYLLLAAIGSRSPWVVLAVVAVVGIGGGELVTRLARRRSDGGRREGPRSGTS